MIIGRGIRTMGFKAWIQIQSNPSIDLTVTLGTDSQSVVAAANGVATVEVKKMGVYTVTNANGTTATINVNKSKQTFYVDCVTVDGFTPGVVTWSTNTAFPYWNTGAYYSGMTVWRNNTQIYSGAGTTQQATATVNSKGVVDSGLVSGTTYAYKFRKYYTVNGRTFYSATQTKTYTAKTCTLARTPIYGTQSWTCPEGIRSLKVFLVGAGGGGGTCPQSESGETTGGGGAGGKTLTKTISVIPGKVYTLAVGTGGPGGVNWGAAGGKGNTTSIKDGNTVLATIDGGDGGGVPFYAGYWSSYTYTSGGRGGNGGSAGGYGRSHARKNSDNEEWASNANGATNGGDVTSLVFRTHDMNNGSTGQGTTTKEYGDSAGTLYSNGAAGGRVNYDSTAGTANTGNGGSGGGGTGTRGGANGGSGIIILKAA